MWSKMQLGNPMQRKIHKILNIFLVYQARIYDAFFAQSAGAVENTDCVSGYNSKQSDGEVPAILELWGMQSTP